MAYALKDISVDGGLDEACHDTGQRMMECGTSLLLERQRSKAAVVPPTPWQNKGGLTINKNPSSSNIHIGIYYVQRLRVRSIYLECICKVQVSGVSVVSLSVEAGEESNPSHDRCVLGYHSS